METLAIATYNIPTDNHLIDQVLLPFIIIEGTFVILIMLDRTKRTEMVDYLSIVATAYVHHACIPTYRPIGSLLQKKNKTK